MKEILLYFLAATISIASSYASYYFKKKAAQIANQTENETAKRYLTEVADAVSTAVAATSQTYVDSLKAENAFTVEAQKEALAKAKETAIAILNPSAAQFIDDIYVDIDAFLTAKIEEAIRVQKNNEPLLLASPIEVSSETTHDTTLAAQFIGDSYN